MIHPDRGFLVAFAKFLGAELALRDVVVGYEPRRALVVLVKVEPGSLRIDDDRVLLFRMHLQQVARHVVGRRFAAVALQANDGLVAQVGHLLSCLRSTALAEGHQRPCACQQQVTLDQVRQAEIGIGLDQHFALLHGHVELVGLDGIEHLRQQWLRTGVRVARLDGRSGRVLLDVAGCLAGRKGHPAREQQAASSNEGA